MVKNIIFILLFLIITGSAFTSGMFFAQRDNQFATPQEILGTFRTPENIQAAKVTSTLYGEMLPWSKEVKKTFAIMSLCNRPAVVTELQKASTELALNKITSQLQEYISNGTLQNRESVIFALSATFMAWLYNVNDQSFIEDMKDFMKKTYGAFNEKACKTEEKKALVFIDAMKFAHE